MPPRLPTSEEPKWHTDFAWFENRFRDMGVSQAEFGRALDIDKGRISRILNGVYAIKPEEVAAFASYFKTTTSEILERLGVDVVTPKTKVRIVGFVNNDGTVRRKRDGLVPSPIEGDASEAIQNDDPSSAFYNWTYYYIPKTNVPIEAIGKLCVVENETGHLLVRIVKHGSLPGKYDLFKLTGAREKSVKLKNASPVLWSRS